MINDSKDYLRKDGGNYVVHLGEHGHYDLDHTTQLMFL